MKPTLEEYNQAKSNMTFASHAIQHCRERRDQLIDELAQERADEKSYLEMYERYKEIVFIYDTYEAIEKGKKK
jgi:hypothetical protein